jgi:uncharacterized cupredoxin-like copper-binding protein
MFGGSFKSFPKNNRRVYLPMVLIATLPLALASCGGDGGLGVGLTEFSISPSENSAEAGEVTFEIENTGERIHEFVVIQTDLAADELPTVDDGSVDEEGEGMEVIDEVEDLPAGESEELTVDLDSGNYVLLCNIVEGDESHYQEGMRTEFTVE